MQSIIKLFQTREKDKWILPVVLLIATFVCLDLFSVNFNWMAFHERDFSKAADFVLGKGLSHLGPELVSGGFTPGPALTLLFSVPVFLFNSPRGIHVLIQLSFVLSAALVFFMIRRRLNRTIAYLSLLLFVTSYSSLQYSYAGWHASLVLPINVIIIFFYDQYLIHKKNKFLFIAGLIAGLGTQVHFSVVAISISNLVYLLFFGRRYLLKTLMYSGAGFISAFLFYIYMDYQNNLINTLYMWDRGGEIISYYDFSSLWDVYCTYVIYVIGYPRVTISSLGITVYSGWMTALIVSWGTILVYFDHYANKATTVKIVSFLLFLIITPVIFPNPPIRYLITTHPAFEILLAISIALILYKFSSQPFIKKSLITCLALMFVLNTFSLLFIIRNDVFGLDVSYRKIGRNLSFSGIQKISEILIDQLALSPRMYEERFYAFRGKTNLWVQRYPLPSDSHYMLMYQEKYPNADKTEQESVLDYGIIFVENQDVPEFNPETLEVFRVDTLEDFKAYYYKGPYFYHQRHNYPELSLEEMKAKTRETNSTVLQRNTDKLYLDIIMEIPAKRHNIKYLHKLVISGSGDALKGYTEIISFNLRESAWGYNAPYFIKDPIVKLIFRDGTHHRVSVMKRHLYSKVEKEVSKIYKRHGTLGSPILGNNYVVSPYGISFQIQDRTISDIDSVVFLNNGYGSTALDEGVNTEMRKKVKL